MNRRYAVTERIENKERHVKIKKSQAKTRKNPSHQRNRGFDGGDNENETLNPAEEEDVIFVLEKQIETYDPESNLEGEYFFFNESPDMIASLIKAFCKDNDQIELL